jgi:hypothetical protein
LAEEACPVMRDRAVSRLISRVGLPNRGILRHFQGLRRQPVAKHVCAWIFSLDRYYPQKCNDTYMHRRYYALERQLQTEDYGSNRSGVQDQGYL